MPSTRPSKANQPATPVRVGVERETLAPFRDLGDQLRAVMMAATSHVIDPRLHRSSAGPSGMHEGVGSEGGFMLQPSIADVILDRAYQTGQILGRTYHYPLAEAGGGAGIPAFDETSRADGQRMGGVRAFWLSEGQAATPSKPALRRLEPPLRKLFALAYLTNELDVDAPGFSPMMENAFANEITFAVEGDVVTGTQGLSGLLKSNALIVVPAAAGETAAGFAFSSTDASNMFRRTYLDPNSNGLVWLAHQDLLGQMLLMQNVGTGTAGLTTQTASLFVPAVAGDGDAPFGRLAGKPVLPCEHCAALGSPGDVILTDLAQYVVADRQPKSLRSIHVRFLNDELAFRLTYRVGGMPIWARAVTPKNGSDTISSIVTLGAR